MTCLEPLGCDWSALLLFSTSLSSIHSKQLASGSCSWGFLFSQSNPYQMKHLRPLHPILCEGRLAHPQSKEIYHSSCGCYSGWTCLLAAHPSQMRAFQCWRHENQQPIILGAQVSPHFIGCFARFHPPARLRRSQHLHHRSALENHLA